MDGSENFDPVTGEVIAATGMPPAIAAAIIAVKKQVKQLGADDRNEHSKYNFVSVDKFYATIGKLMADAGLALLIDETSAEVKTSERKRDDGKDPATWLFVEYNLAFLHETGALSRPLRRSCALPISGPQAYGAAQSYIEKQFLRQVFKVPTGERDADETKQDEGGAQGLSGGRTAQGSTPAARTGHQRQQAAPAPSEKKVEATKRYKELRDEIDASMTVPSLESLDGCPAWVAFEKILREVEAKETADNAVEQLRNRIERRREMLTGGEKEYEV